MHQTPTAVADAHRVRPVGERGSVNANGLLLVDKPAGVTSHDVVARCRRAVATKRVGHAGTLDPFATGLLVLGIGSATRLLPYLDGEPKVYDARFHFGYETDTDDVMGTATMSAQLPDWTHLQPAIDSLTGSISQIPPSFSAKHVNGERAYDMARRGDVVKLEPVVVTVHQWHITEHTSDSLTVTITCSGGTYIRALARDLGRLLHSAAHCDLLRRFRSGVCSVQNATPYAALERGALAGGLIQLQSPLAALQEMNVITLTPANELDIRNGRAIAAHLDNAIAAVTFNVTHSNRAVLVNESNDIVGIANLVEGNRWQPKVVLPASGSE